MLVEAEDACSWRRTHGQHSDNQSYFCPHVSLAHTLLVSANYKCWLQGYNATPQNIELVIAAFRDGLQQQGLVKN